MTDDLEKIRDRKDVGMVSPEEKRSIEAAIETETAKTLRQAREERKKYAARIFWMICIWLSWLMLLFVFQGFLGLRGWFSLSDVALVAIATTTTASVIGIFFLVVKHLFPVDRD